MKKVRVQFFVQDADSEEVAHNLYRVLLQLLPLSAECLFAIHAGFAERQDGPVEEPVVCVLSDQAELIEGQRDDSSKLKGVGRDEWELTRSIIRGSRSWLRRSIGVSWSGMAGIARLSRWMWFMRRGRLPLATRLASHWCSC
jgi:hypothetical protein